MRIFWLWCWIDGSFGYWVRLLGKIMGPNVKGQRTVCYTCDVMQMVQNQKGELRRIFCTYAFIGD